VILIIDNYDSFVYNLARYVKELGFDYQVARNDKFSLADVKKIQPTHIIISPGPCDPDKSGISLEIVLNYFDKVPILGVCLGHQAIGQAFGGKVLPAKKPMHGKSTYIKHDGNALFYEVSNPLKIGRYHSLIVGKEGLSEDIIITAYSDEDEIMAMQHKSQPVYGVQFHPESVLTECGHKLLENFLS